MARCRPAQRSARASIPRTSSPRLPGNEKEASAGWSVCDDREGSTVHYEPISSKAPETTFDFTADQTTFMERIYEGKDRRTFQFDRERGLVVRAEIEIAYGAHMQGGGRGTLELTSVAELGPEKMAVLGSEMDRYFDAQQACRDLFKKARIAGDKAEALIQKARAILADARAAVERCPRSRWSRGTTRASRLPSSA